MIYVSHIFLVLFKSTRYMKGEQMPSLKCIYVHLFGIKVKLRPYILNKKSVLYGNYSK